MLGSSYLMIKDIKKGREFLQKSVDDDGFPARALSSLREIEKSVSKKYDSLSFADSVENFYNLLDTKASYKELFSDFQHPSFLGHIIIANNFLCKILELEPFKSNPFNKDCLNLDSADLKSLVIHYKKELKVTDEDESRNALMIARWHIGMAEVSAYPEDFLNAAQEYVSKFYEKSNKSLDDEVMKLVFSALIESQKDGDQQKALNLINQAQELSPTHVNDILYNKRLGTGELFIDAFNKKGIFYASNKKTFVFRNGAAN
jgi:tetratricopeptide (TPR) repeat protein